MLSLLRKRKRVSETVTEELKSTDSTNESTQPTSSEQLTENEQYNIFIWIRGTKEHGYFATIGKYKITPTFSKKRRVIQELEDKSLNLIATIIDVMITINKEQNKN